MKHLNKGGVMSDTYLKAILVSGVGGMGIKIYTRFTLGFWGKRGATENAVTPYFKWSG